MNSLLSKFSCLPSDTVLHCTSSISSLLTAIFDVHDLLETLKRLARFSSVVYHILPTIALSTCPPPPRLRNYHTISAAPSPAPL